MMCLHVDTWRHMYTHACADTFVDVLMQERAQALRSCPCMKNMYIDTYVHVRV